MEETQPTQTIQSDPVGFPGGPTAPTSPQKKSWKWILILVLFLVVIGAVTFFVFKSSKSASNLEGSPTPEATSGLTNTLTPEPSPTTSAAPTVDKSQIKIQVLNGTGIAGAAGVLATQLKDLGYTNVTTGNSSTQNATDTQVTFSSTVSQDVVSEITSKLKSLYINVSTGNSTIDGFDIQIITGLGKNQTSVPAATTAPSATDTPTPASTSTPTATP